MPSKVVKSKVEKAKATATAAKQKAKEVKVVSRVGGRGADFVDFIREQGVVGMAVGLAVGTVAAGTVKNIVEGFVTPVVQFIVGSQAALEGQSWHVELWGRSADFQWGLALSSTITLVATLAVIYFVVKVAKLDRLDKKKA